MLIRKKSFLSSASLTVMALTLTTLAAPAHAGFEWTPPEKAAPAPLPARQAAPPHIPMDSSALPEVDDFDVIDEEAPPPLPAMQETARESGKMKVLDMRPEPQEQPVVMSAPITPDTATNTTPEPFPLTETHQGQDAVMPEPGPVEAASQAPAPSGLSINPYPLESGHATPPAEPTTVASAPTQSEEINWHGHEVIEGFGSDMPLALALQQVVPANYAFSFGKGVNPGNLVSWEGGKPWDQVLGDMVRPLNLQAVIEGNVIKVLSKSAPLAPVTEPDQGAALAPVPAMDGPIRDQEFTAVAPEEIKLKPVSEKEAKEMAKEAKALQDVAEIEAPIEEQAAAPVKEMAEVKPEPQVKKASSSRNVILDPGESKPMQPANGIKKQVEPEKLVEAAPEAAPPSDTALESAAQKKTAPDASQQLSQPRIWEAKRGSSLKETLDGWTKQANIPLTWNATEDFKLSSDILISGTFDNAVKVLFAQALKKGGPSHTLKTGPSAELVVGEAVAEDKASSG